MSAPAGRPRAVLVVTGSELLLGRIQDANTQLIARRLDAAGVRLVRVTTVGDDEEGLVAALRDALAEAPELVVTSGGLGPTHDDRTVAAVARATGVGLAVDAPMRAKVAAIIERYARARGTDPATFAPGVDKQATAPVGAALIDPVGTAPGVVHVHGATTILVLPGPPRELAGMWPAAAAHPRLAAILGGAHPYARVLRTFGAPESLVGDAFAAAGGDAGGTETTICAARAEVEVVVRDAGGGAGRVDALADAMRARLGDAVFAEGEAPIEELLLDALRARGLTVATAESCTAGLVAARLAGIAGASDALVGGVVAYANEVKRDVLGVPADLLERHGAVSAEVARAMAESGRRVTGADVALAVTGIAGPGGGSAEKPVGLVHLAVATPAGVVHEERRFGDAPRDTIREWSVTVALHLARRALDSV